jgi:hypothetical protein
MESGEMKDEVREKACFLAEIETLYELGMMLLLDC